MSKLAGDLAKMGLKVAKNADTKKKKKTNATPLTADQQEHVDAFLKADQDEKSAKAAKAKAQKEIRGMAFGFSFDNGTLKNLVLEGQTGAVNVNFKDQYAMKDRAELDQILVEKGLDPDHYVTESTALSFDYEALTDAEREKVLALLKTFGEERFAAVVSTTTKFAISGLKDKMVSISENQDELDTLREACGHYAPTVARRK